MIANRVVLFVALLSASSLFGAIPTGKASGAIVVSGKSTPVKFAYVVEKNTLLRIIVSDKELSEADLEEASSLSSDAEENGIAAVVVQLNEDGKAEEVFFFHPKLPAGLSVRELSTFQPKKTASTKLSGRIVLDDPGNSFTYDVTFEAPIVHSKVKSDPLPADATPAQHALWRLKQLEIEYDESSFRSRILRDDADAVKLFLEAGMPVETQNALGEAVERGNAKIVKMLIDAGADVNKRDESGGSLVMAATEKPEVMKLLIDAHADVNAVNEYKVDALAEAAEQGHNDVVKMLLAAGAKVNHRDPSGGTALSVAVLRGYKDVIHTLIDAGADVKRDKEDLLDLAKDKPEIRAMIEAAARKK
ncbi:MAG TPA: ankyrin repeat domain-containing protein [Thermoanaerobaculia bacterium]|nr:ankyrin repeat domain-containing protein [Thermoanaerobaculia bacterium]